MRAQVKCSRVEPLAYDGNGVAAFLLRDGGLPSLLELPIIQRVDVSLVSSAIGGSQADLEEQFLLFQKQ